MILFPNFFLLSETPGNFSGAKDNWYAVYGLWPMPVLHNQYALKEEMIQQMIISSSVQTFIITLFLPVDLSIFIIWISLFLVLGVSND